MAWTDDMLNKRKIRMDIVDQTFGRLTVLEFSHTNKHGKSMWKCKCDCGNERIVAGSHLKNGHTSSCGCTKNEIVGSRYRTHGMRKTRLYRIWLNIKNRCTNPKDEHFKDYGGRGITVCDEWKNNFEAFHEWSMANGYEEHLTIDRIDVNGNYCPENCRWTTQKEQARNKRNTVFIELNGEIHSLSEWSEIIGVCYPTLFSRYKAGKTPVEILKEKAV